MNADVIRYEFERHIDLNDAEMSLHLAMFAVEGMFGRARVRLETEYQLVEPNHQITVGTGNEVGAMLVCVFTALLIREFGEDSFSLERVYKQPQQPAEVCA